jgi:hypothetical protein
MPTRSGARHRYASDRCGMTFRHRYDEVGLPCRNTTGAPLPVSTYVMLVPSTPTLRRGWGSATEGGIVAWVWDITHFLSGAGLRPVSAWTCRDLA